MPFKTFGIYSVNMSVVTKSSTRNFRESIARRHNMNKWEEIKKVIEGADKDAEKFYSGSNKAAGTRLRAALLAIKDLAHEGRKEVTELKGGE